ncbi:MAG: hypothetical protein MPJ24_07545 [Pirellulaceae bacterium]|nr:hypothetical protein [Pirellulaceae bacterium]
MLKGKYSTIFSLLFLLTFPTIIVGQEKAYYDFQDEMAPAPMCGEGLGEFHEVYEEPCVKHDPPLILTMPENRRTLHWNDTEDLPETIFQDFYTSYVDFCYENSNQWWEVATHKKNFYCLGYEEEDLLIETTPAPTSLVTDAVTFATRYPSDWSCHLAAYTEKVEALSNHYLLKYLYAAEEHPPEFIYNEYETSTVYYAEQDSQYFIENLQNHLKQEMAQFQSHFSLTNLKACGSKVLSPVKSGLKTAAYEVATNLEVVFYYPNEDGTESFEQPVPSREWAEEEIYPMCGESLWDTELADDGLNQPW